MRATGRYRHPPSPTWSTRLKAKMTKKATISTIDTQPTVISNLSRCRAATLCREDLINFQRRGLLCAREKHSRTWGGGGSVWGCCVGGGWAEGSDRIRNLRMSRVILVKCVMVVGAIGRSMPCTNPGPKPPARPSYLRGCRGRSPSMLLINRAEGRVRQRTRRGCALRPNVGSVAARTVVIVPGHRDTGSGRGSGRGPRVVVITHRQRTR